MDSINKGLLDRVEIILEWHKLVEVTLYFCLCSINRQPDLQNVPLDYIYSPQYFYCALSAALVWQACRAVTNSCITFFYANSTFFCMTYIDELNISIHKSD